MTFISKVSKGIERGWMESKYRLLQGVVNDCRFL